MSERDPAQFLPVNPRTLLVLLALMEQPQHGYAIKQDAEARSDGQVTLDAGALYRTIARLVDDGLIQESTPPTPDSDARRRTYGLTALGRKVVALETARLASLVAFAQGAAGAR